MTPCRENPNPRQTRFLRDFGGNDLKNPARHAGRGFAHLPFFAAWNARFLFQARGFAHFARDFAHFARGFAHFARGYAHFSRDFAHFAWGCRGARLPGFRAGGQKMFLILDIFSSLCYNLHWCFILNRARGK